MKSVLIVGSGAREHALAWKLRQSPDVGRLLVAPGNAGTATIAENVPVAATDIDGLARLVEERDVDLTVVGPEAPLALGLADRLRALGRRVVGPDAAAARIESSKAFAKDLMRRAQVPTASYRVCDDSGSAFRYLNEARYPLVVKADGLAAGKGVVICEDVRQARAAVESIMLDRVHGNAGERVVIEQALSGREISLLALVDGERVVPLPIAQDHKRLLDGDRGPNTGGMGACAPVPCIGEDERARLVELLMLPVVRALAGRGMPYRGILFAGLILTADGPYVLEYNCRLGDPETQVILPLLDGDLLPWLEMAAAGTLEGAVPTIDRKAAGIVLAAGGYPEGPELGRPIGGLGQVSPDLLVFHAGTARHEDGTVVTAGGRVLTVVALADTIEQAAEMAYAAPIHFEGMRRRRDIGRGADGCQLSDVSSQPSSPASARGPYHISSADNSQLTTSTIAVLASGEGTNLQALLDACAAGALQARISVVISHNPQAGALERARRAGIPAVALSIANRRDPAQRRALEEQLLEALAPYHPDLIVLAGWMLILSAAFLDRCGCQVINVHPALLPHNGHGARAVGYESWAGAPSPQPTARGPQPAPHSEHLPLRGPHAVRDAITLGLARTGVSVHLVTPAVDDGPVIISEPVEIHPDDDETALYRRIKPVEHRLLVQAVNRVLSLESRMSQVARPRTKH